MNTINLTDETFKRLEAKAMGFDTPEKVIKRLLDEVDGKTSKPELIFEPSDEDEFKRQLIETREAEIAIYYADGKRKISHWDAKNFSSRSNLRGNLWSGYLRDWKRRNIIRAELAILPIAVKTHKDDDNDNTKDIALAIGLKYKELALIDGYYEIHEDDGIMTFYPDCPKEILDKISDLDSSKSLRLDRNIFGQPESEEPY